MKDSQTADTCQQDGVLWSFCTKIKKVEASRNLFCLGAIVVGENTLLHWEGGVKMIEFSMININNVVFVFYNVDSVVVKGYGVNTSWIMLDCTLILPDESDTYVLMFGFIFNQTLEHFFSSTPA